MTLEQAISQIKKSSSLYDLHRNLCAAEQALADEEAKWRFGDHEEEGGDWWLKDHDFDTEGVLRSHGVDICELPTFGGHEPRSTIEVWSWDKNSLLVGTGAFREWEIVDRKEWRA